MCTYNAFYIYIYIYIYISVCVCVYISVVCVYISVVCVCVCVCVCISVIYACVCVCISVICRCVCLHTRHRLIERRVYVYEHLYISHTFTFVLVSKFVLISTKCHSFKGYFMSRVRELCLLYLLIFTF